MLRIYAAIVVVTATLAVGCVLLASAYVDRQSGKAAAQASAAITAAQIQADLRPSIATLFITAYAFLGSEEMAALSPEIREVVLYRVMEEFARDNVGIVPFPPVTVEMQDRDAFRLQSDVASVVLRVDRLVEDIGGDYMAPVVAERSRLEAALSTYIDTKSGISFRDTFVSLVELGERLDEASSVIAADLQASQAALDRATSIARWTMIIAFAALAVILLAAAFYTARVIQRAFAAGENERRELQAAKRNLESRNRQLRVLHNMTVEISDTLSMPYLIKLTLQETLSAMQASVVVLRLLKGNDLVVVGSLTEEGEELGDIPPKPLGEGPGSRVARRGRSARFASGAASILNASSPDVRHDGLESGIIVPLIIGARVVGTLACWSKERAAYTDEDERMLEMIASQVATAVAVADSMEVFERRALHDPLTRLPNRRHLAQEMTANLARWEQEGEPCVVGLVDIDHFKRLNDEYGHAVGDLTLQRIAMVMRQTIRETDRIYRYGGEEFVIVFRDTDLEGAESIAQRVLAAVAETPLAGENLERIDAVTVSIGLAALPEHGTDFLNLIDLADKALYRAKQSGRNRVIVWEEADTDADVAGTGLFRIA